MLNYSDFRLLTGQVIPSDVIRLSHQELVSVSRTLFLMIMDPLLKELERRSVGPCIGGLYCGAFAHADDIRTISTSRDTLHEQISVVESFTVTNALMLNAQKCEVVVVSPTKPADVSVCTVAGHQLVPSTSAKCLGHWWSWDLSSVKAINEAIGKARKCFFAYGAVGAFDGQLKFNVVMYGIDECPEGMKKPQRASQDHESVVDVIKTLDSTLDKQSVRDCFRLGRYVKEKRRPILVKLACASNAFSVLSNRKKLFESEKYSKISIKRDMTRSETQEESLLLKERLTLIKAGTSRKDLKIRGNQLFVRNIVVGSVIDMTYVPVTAPVLPPSHNSSPDLFDASEQSPPSSQPIITSHENQSPSISPSHT